MRPSRTPRRTPPSTPALPPHPSHTPDVHLSPQIRMQFPNRSDSVVQSDTNKQGVQRELHAKLPDTALCPRKVARNSPRTSFTNSSKTAEYQRSHFKTRNILKGITCEIAEYMPRKQLPEPAARPAGPGRSAGGRRQGQGRLRDDAPSHTSATRRRRCGGLRRDRRARAGFEARRRTK